MSLNDYRDEVNAFLQKVRTEQEDIIKITGMLDEEIILLKESLDNNDKLSHQVYDAMFLLFEIAAIKGLDLDLEWIKGRERKRVKYTGNIYWSNNNQ
jgi:hypothetical protein